MDSRTRPVSTSKLKPVLVRVDLSHVNILIKNLISKISQFLNPFKFVYSIEDVVEKDTEDYICK